MWDKYYLVIWSLCIPWINPISGLDVTVTDSHCEHKGEVLFCDYKDVDQGKVAMQRLNDANLKKVFLYNINELSLSEEICVNVGLHNVTVTEIPAGNGSKCENDIELSAKKSNLPSIPRIVNSLYLEESNVESISTDTVFSKLYIISSTITKFNMTKSLMKNTKAVIQDSKILTLQKMIIGNASSLSVHKSTINVEKEGSLEIDNGEVTVKESTITGPKGNMVLCAGGNITVGTQQGEVTVTAGECSSSKTVDSDQQCSSYLVPFIVCLVLFILSSIIGVLAFIFKDKLVKQSVENTGQENLSLLQNFKTNIEVKKDAIMANFKGSKGADSKPGNGENTANVVIHKESLETVKTIKLKYESEKNHYKEEEKKIVDEISKLKQAKISEPNPIQENPEQADSKEKDTKKKGKERKKDKTSTLDYEYRNKDLHQLISFQFRQMSCCFKFLGSLQENQVTVISSLLSDSCELSEAHRAKAEFEIKAHYYSGDRHKPCQTIFSEYKEKMKTVLSLITIPYDKNNYKNKFNMTPDLAHSFEELAEHLKKNDSLKKKALHYCAQKIEENMFDFQDKLLNFALQNIKKDVQYSERTLKYMIKSLEDTPPNPSAPAALSAVVETRLAEKTPANPSAPAIQSEVDEDRLAEKTPTEGALAVQISSAAPPPASVDSESAGPQNAAD